MARDSTIEARALAALERYLEQPPAQRSEWLNAQFGGEPDLMARVQELAAADQGTGLETSSSPAVQMRAAALLPRTIGAYAIIEQIGQGGMGEVYLAERNDGLFEQQVAVKVVGASMRSDAALKQFNDERQILASLSHPHIASLLDGGTTANGVPYVVMEFVPGVSLAQYLAQNDVALDARLTLFKQICEAVSHAHQRLIIHRDIKPSNVLVTENGVCKLVDFGIAKYLGDFADLRTHTVAQAHTPAYASPEQVGGGELTTATDIYSLGALLFYLISNELPLVAQDGSSPQSQAEWIEAVLNRDPLPPSSIRGALTLKGGGGRDLDLVATKALAKEPHRRYATVNALIEDIESIQRGHPVTARPRSLFYVMRRFVSRNKFVTSLASIFAISLLVSAVISYDSARTAQQALEDSESVTAFLREIITSPSDAAVGSIRARRDTPIGELLDVATQRAGTAFVDRPIVQATLYEALAATHNSVGQWEQASALSHRALDLVKNEVDVGHPIQWRVRATHHYIHSWMNSSQESLRPDVMLEDYRQSILLSDGLESKAYAMYEILVAGDLANNEEKLAALLAAEANYLKYGGAPDDLPMGRAAHAKGVALEGLGRIAQARDTLNRAVQILQHGDGRADQLTAAVYVNLGFLEYRANDMELSRDYFERALAIHQSLAHPSGSMVFSLGTLGNYHHKVGNLELARDYWQQARAAQAKFELPDSSTPAITLTLGQMQFYQTTGEFEKGKALCQNQLAAFAETDIPLNLGARAFIEYTLAFFHAKLGEMEQAREIAAQSMQNTRKALGDEHELVAFRQGLIDQMLAP